MYSRDARAWLRLMVVVVALATAVVAAGCGDSDDGGSNGNGGDGGTADASGDTKPASSGSAEDQIKQAVDTFQRAGLDGDVKTVCASLTTAYRKSLEKRGKQSCEKSFKELLANPVKGQKIPEVTSIERRGDKATVKYKGGPNVGSIRVVREAGDWKMDLGTVETKLDVPGPDAPQG